MQSVLTVSLVLGQILQPELVVGVEFEHPAERRDASRERSSGKRQQPVRSHLGRQLVLDVVFPAEILG